MRKNENNTTRKAQYAQNLKKTHHSNAIRRKITIIFKTQEIMTEATTQKVAFFRQGE